MKENLTEAVNTIYREYHGGYYKTLISPAQTNGALAMMEMVLPQGAEPPMHMHAHEDETFYLIEGEMEFIIGGQTLAARPGEAIFAARGIPHLFKLLSPQVRFITLLTPGKLWEYFQEFSTPTVGEPMIRPLPGPPPQDYLDYLVNRMTNAYGITFTAAARVS
ncbi:cupin domain-containing protein [Mucilaginibacter limnophilus]|uniref:Cupin domain-containing protein n=1 Tax=Mucilaginibacter limnophilus TaxID=1932778 RepID=A0A3S2UNR0_9SPHI|nr:cupin domain-containing protein [Mucilaginibacter limnophilus]RVU02977.1 cupin domain-containing protein [Mucilaginibacter limnophilus]